MNKYNTLNKMVVLYVLFIMLFAGFMTSILFFILYSIGVSQIFLLTPVLTPFIALLISSIIGTSISAVANEKVLRPLNQLIKATKIISTGNFDVRVEEMNNISEISSLLRGFNHMAKELDSIELFRNDFINNFSHEIKTPIVSISGFAKQLQNENLSPQKRKEYTDIIISESERLSNMSTNILLLTNYENQQIITNQSEYELDEQIRNCIILLEKKWTKKNLGIDIDLIPVKMFGNAEMLSHLWLNLLDNAIKYSAYNGHISISSSQDADSIQVMISDCGNGMDDEVLKNIFVKFYQGDKSHIMPGNGLGLSIVKRIVELYDGKIAVKSKPGQGTTFTVYLPKSQAV